MASDHKMLGVANIANNNVNTLMYTVPNDVYSVVQIKVTNLHSDPVDVSIGLSATGTPGANEWLEYQNEIPVGGSIERSGVVLEATRNVVINVADTAGGTANVSAVLTGVEVGIPTE